MTPVPSEQRGPASTSAPTETPGVVAEVVDTVRRHFLAVASIPGDPRDALEAIITEQFPLLDPPSRQVALDDAYAALIGLGPLDALVRDPLVTDVLVNGAGPVWVEREGRLHRTTVVVTPADIATILERSFHRTGLSIDRAHPVGDTRLADGSRISAVLPPLAVDGPHIAIRRFAATDVSLEAFGDRRVAEWLRTAVGRCANIVVFGATGTGKTTLVNALASSIDPGQRVVTIEDAAELRLPLPHVVRLEGRPANGDGAGGVELRDLVRAALRLRPDRIVVGEVRGPEALDMIWAMATGHAGSLSTCHATSAADALTRLETFVMLADAALPLPAVRAQVRSAVDVLVGLRRVAGHRVITSIHTVVTDPAHPSGVSAVYAEGRWA